jgi:WS/DGAT C-terminal domain
VGVEAQDERVVGDPLPAHVTVGDVLTVEMRGYRFAESGIQSSALISEPSGANEANGARLDGNYPLGIALDGQAVDITLVNNADNLDFGLVGGRRSVPHLQRLVGRLEDELKALERAVGV